MLTATKDLMLAATVTGSWPRPRWFTTGMNGRPLDKAMLDVGYREQFPDALSAVLDDQERGGLDILTNGDYFHDEDFAGHSWMHYPVERWKGFAHDELQTDETRWQMFELPPGTLMNEIMTGWRWPWAVDRVEHNPHAPLEYAKIHRIAQQRTRKPVKFGTVAPQCISTYLDVHTDVYDDDKRQLVWDMTMAMNRELRELAANGCKVIQLEEPLVHYVAHHNPQQTDYIDFLVDVWNAGVEGLDEVEIWMHTCWGNPNMQRVVDVSSYANSIEIYLDRMKADVWTIETKDNGFMDLHLFEPWKGRLPKKIAIGVVSHRQLQVESAGEVAADVRRALEFIDADKLLLTSDCGFGRQGCNRAIAHYKAAAIARGRNIVLRELGVEERYIPAADPGLQYDIIDKDLAAAGFTP
jgi:5-methyltetrahydropteroyltriglutamate--homocysteine methyltransferase